MSIVYPHIPSIGCELHAGTSTADSVSLNTADVRVAYIRRMARSGTLQKLRIGITNVAGTIPFSDIVCQLHADNVDTPGGTIGTQVPLSGSGNVPGAGIYEFDFSSQNISLSAGERYWFVVRNINATPGTNNVTLQRGFDASVFGWGNNYLEGAVATSTNAGASYTYNGTNRQAFLVILNSGSEGFVYRHGGSAQPNFGNTMRGVLFTTPANAKWRVIAAGFRGIKNGSPTTITFRIYQGSTLIAETQNIASYPSGRAGDWYAKFASVVELEPNTQYRLVAYTNGDASNNFAIYTSICDTSNENYANMPFSSRYTYTTNGGSSWTEDLGNMVNSWFFLLDSAQPYASAGGGGGGGLLPIHPHLIIA